MASLSCTCCLPGAAPPGLWGGQYRASLFPTGTPTGTGWLLSLLELSALCPGMLCWAHSLEMEWGNRGQLSFGTRAMVLAPVMPSRPPACQERSAQPWAPDLTDKERSLSSFWECSQPAEQHNARPFVPHLLVLRMLEGEAGPQLCAGWIRFQEGLMHVSEWCVFTHFQVREKSYWKDTNNDAEKNLKVLLVPRLLTCETSQSC